jgi:hypothetical protein
MSVEDILTAIQALPPDERSRLRAELDQRLSAEQDAKAQTFREALLASGLVTKFKAPRTGKTSRPRRLIEVKGKPLSETIIEERR